jgi:4-alpha-glucanotransferase
MDPGENEAERSFARARLREALGLPEHMDADFPAVASYLARTPSRLLVLAMEDVLGLLDQPNVPGTVHEHPNWRRRLPATLEDVARDKRLAVLADIMVSAGRSARK